MNFTLLPHLSRIILIPHFLSGLALQGDALFQMGRFEHALVIYHRGNRLRNGTDDDFKVGIQKATTSINNCLKNVRVVREIPAKRRISTWSFKSGKSTQEVDVFAPNAHPFKDDIAGLKVLKSARKFKFHFLKYQFSLIIYYKMA